MEVPTRIFISYHRTDSEADAGRLADTLRRRLGNDRVFTDVIDIEYGASWRRVVEHTINNSIAMLLVMGPAWTLTDPIKYEVGLAFASGISIIPVLVRRAKWEDLVRDLPSELSPLRGLSAGALDHSSWDRDVDPLIQQLERALADPGRARVILQPPTPISVLESPLNPTNIRSLLFHAADLAECLDDAAVLADAQRAAPKSSPDSSKYSDDEPPTYDLVKVLMNARYRLMMEQIGRDLLKFSTGQRAAQFLQDTVLEEEVRSKWKEFDEVASAYSAARGDTFPAPGEYKRDADEADAKAKDHLRKRLPGLTKSEETRNYIYKIVENQVRSILSKESIEASPRRASWDRSDHWEYVVLKHFSSYPDMPLGVPESKLPSVRAMLAHFEDEFFK